MCIVQNIFLTYSFLLQVHLWIFMKMNEWSLKIGFRWGGCPLLTMKGHCPSQGYEGCAARNCRLFHECWKHFLSNWDMFSTKHRLVIYPDGIARETMHFIAGLLGDQQVYLVHLVYLFYHIYLEYLLYLVYLLTYRKEINIGMTYFSFWKMDPMVWQQKICRSGFASCWRDALAKMGKRKCNM